MSFFTRTFGALQLTYVIRAYAIGFALFGLIGWVQFHAPNNHGQTDRYLSLGYFLVCSLVFPFAKLVWDELRDVALGGNLILVHGLVALVLKVFINGMLGLCCVRCAGRLALSLVPYPFGMSAPCNMHL